MKSYLNLATKSKKRRLISKKKEVSKKRYQKRGINKKEASMPPYHRAKGIWHLVAVAALMGMIVMLFVMNMLMLVHLSIMLMRVGVFILCMTAH
ncbi:MAG TPA: hypothetical protein PKZ03_00025 [Methanothrix sp.]|uniref:hypothetical protein n=2 Tax=Methanothrix sp. TaxID=90426 RepID=UPI002C7B61D0|nr:hypothetical protein [Methanothrix sp.]